MCSISVWIVLLGFNAQFCLYIANLFCTFFYRKTHLPILVSLKKLVARTDTHPCTCPLTGQHQCCFGLIVYTRSPYSAVDRTSVVTWIDYWRFWLKVAAAVSSVALCRSVIQHMYMKLCSVSCHNNSVIAGRLIDRVTTATLRARVAKCFGLRLKFWFHYNL